jgi:hypothetical protein
LGVVVWALLVAASVGWKLSVIWQPVTVKSERLHLICPGSLTGVFS